MRKCDVPRRLCRSNVAGRVGMLDTVVIRAQRGDWEPLLLGGGRNQPGELWQGGNHPDLRSHAWAAFPAAPGPTPGTPQTHITNPVRRVATTRPAAPAPTGQGSPSARPAGAPPRAATMLARTMKISAQVDVVVIAVAKCTIEATQ